MKTLKHIKIARLYLEVILNILKKNIYDLKTLKVYLRNVNKSRIEAYIQFHT